MLGQSNFYKAVRRFAVMTPVWGTAIRHTVIADEVNDLTVISRRVYGTNDDALAVMAAAGLDRVDQPLLEGSIIVLPTRLDLQAIKNSTGYGSS